MDAVELLRSIELSARGGAVGETAAFAGFFAERLRGPLEWMDAELAGRGDTRTVRADFRLVGDPDRGTIGGVEVALVLSDGTEFSRRYGLDAEGVFTGDRSHALACLLGDAARRFGLKDCYGRTRTWSIDVDYWRRLAELDAAAERERYEARRDESVRFGAGVGDGELAETELRYVEVPKGGGGLPGVDDGSGATYDAAKYGCDVRDADGFCRSMVDVGHIYMPSKTGPYNDTYYVSVGVIEVEGRRVGYAVVVDAEAYGGSDMRDGGVANASYTLEHMGIEMHAFGKTFVLDGKTPMETFTEVYESMLKDGRDFVATVLQRLGVTEMDAVSHKCSEKGE